MPNVSSAAAQDVRIVRVTFSGALADLTTGANGALNPSNWTFAGQAGTVNGTAIIPAAAVTAKSVVQVSTSIVDVTVSDDFSYGRTYQVTASTSITGVPVAPNNQTTFTAVTPDAPADRDFDVTTFMPRMNLAEDDTKDLIKLLYVFRDVVLVLLNDLDRWTRIFDISKAPANFLDLMLQDLGDPFPFTLTELEKRRLLTLLVSMYKQKGTNQGFKNAIRFFLGYEAEYIWPDLSKLYGGWVLGTNDLDIDTVLGDHAYYNSTIHGPDTGTLGSSFEFYAKIGTPSSVALTSDESTRASAIAEYMKPVNMRVLSVLVGLPPPTNVQAVAGSGQLTISWTAVTSATGYRIFWSKTPVVNTLSPDGVADPDNASPYVMAGVAAGETRWIVVAARDAGGINGVGSSIVSATAT